MIQTKEEMFLAELGINPKEEIELAYSAKIKITDLLKKYADQQLILSVISQRSEMYFAFMEEYNALMGESEHQILKEEVIVLLAKYCG